jgi:hypothetical protein
MAADEIPIPARRTGNAGEPVMDSPLPPSMSLGDVFSALTPPGTDGKALLAALKGARRPTIPLPASDEDARHYSPCPRCDTVHDSRVLCDDESLWAEAHANAAPVDEGLKQEIIPDTPSGPGWLHDPAWKPGPMDGQFSAPASLPADPFTAGDLRATALSQFWHESVEAGIPVESVDRIIGVMLAEAHGGKQA